MFGIPIPSLTAIKWGAIALGAIGLASAGAYGGYRFELGRYESLVAANAKAMTVAVNKARDDEKRIAAGNQADATMQAYYTGKADAITINLTIGVHNNVTIEQDTAAAAASTGGCITYGFVRVLIAGERVQPAESFPIPSGESVDTCTALEPSELAAALAQDLSAGAQNGHQLDSLIAAVKRNDAIVVGSVPADMGQPNDIGDRDGQASPPGQRQVDNGIEPQIIDAPGTEKRGGEPVDAGKRLAAADRADVQDLEAGGAQLKSSLGEVGIHGGTLPSRSISTQTHSMAAHRMESHLGLTPQP